MSETPANGDGAPTAAAPLGGTLLERFRRDGKRVVILEEMLLLGFWPPDDETAEKRDQALADLRIAMAELRTLRAELRRVEGEIEAVTDVEALIAAIRARRIERVRHERTLRREAGERERVAKREEDAARRLDKPPFLGYGVSGGLRYEGGDDAKLTSLGLPVVHSAGELAVAIGVEPRELAWLTYHRGAASLDHYHRFVIPKRSGGTRVISSPKSRLRVAQSWVLRDVLSKFTLHDAAMAFRPALSIVDNARLHQGRAVVVRIDLKDFFPSIGFPRVKGLFASFGYNEGVASILALLTTEAPRVALTLDGQRSYVAVGDRRLPQGACTSPALTNVLCRGLDARLTALGARFGFRYTRYADDLVFSHAAPDVSIGAFLAIVQGVVANEGFTINADKTRVMRSSGRQTVNGLVVNGPQSSAAGSSTPASIPVSSRLEDAEDPAPDQQVERAGVRLSRHDLRRFRAFLHSCDTKGFDAMSVQLGKDARAYADGYLAYVSMVSPDKAAAFAAAHPWLGVR